MQDKSHSTCTHTGCYGWWNFWPWGYSPQVPHHQKCYIFRSHIKGILLHINRHWWQHKITSKCMCPNKDTYVLSTGSSITYNRN